MRTALATVGQMMLAAAVAVVVAVVALVAIARVQWPAYPSSNQLHALTTVGQVGCLAGLAAAAVLSRRGRQVLAWLVAVTFVSAFAVVTLAMPLGATKLYLFGISVDQQFRTEYLTRLTDSPRLADMTYLGLPPYYPPGWFWLGGRAAAWTGTPAWEMYKPWAITSMAVAVAVALVLWNRMIRFELALLVTIAGAAVTLAYSSPEPYAAIITVLLPPVLVLAWSGLRAGYRLAAPTPAEREAALTVGAEREASFTLGGRNGWGAVAGTGLFLGFAATFYTLLVAYGAFTVTLMAVVLAASRAVTRAGVKTTLSPLARLAVIGVIAAALASITWTPYLLATLRRPAGESRSAFHYLPGDGAELSFPMLQFTLLGALCLLGTLWLVVRASTSTRAAALAIGVVGVYLWSMLSMLSTLARTTLLSFRLQPTLTVLLATAGVFGFVEGARALGRAAQGWHTVVYPAATAVGLAGALAFSQDIPEVLRPDITVAYTDTDGHGERGDRRPPGAVKYYEAVDAAILAATGRPRNETVVLTADYSFLSYYPYWGFQGLTPHYANPLAQFSARAAAIEAWSTLETSEQFTHALDDLAWPAPTVFLMRPAATDSYTLRLAKDVYPNHPNVRRYTVELGAALFAGPQFRVQKIGPFVLAVRT
ncbi:arabinofuranosyltransferase [Mycolicibacter minnesotensis]|uniref:Galactan 5-O-arabinofuranosyltransferase n=1 Tax=Mycolicibacter minnesotensis TaxID=1118379 RepID=A0A7I7R4C8_9MYCO|nr:galactan 5-O-arabinofuranosyltransferase [Mycolicibacter minnesotensis]ORA97273.1 arabinofuranosyltransferase [Mycolicibacter minnesotensis]BBY33484.1 arabinofuranosyltransferase AftA [Mycolicibacter minnesotensis]